MKKHRKSIPRGHLALSQCAIQSIQMHTIESKFLANVEHNRSFAGHLRHQEHLLPFENILPKRDHSCAGLWSVCFSTVEEDPSIVLKWRVYIAHIVSSALFSPPSFTMFIPRDHAENMERFDNMSDLNSLFQHAASIFFPAWQTNRLEKHITWDPKI